MIAGRCGAIAARCGTIAARCDATAGRCEGIAAECRPLRSECRPLRSNCRRLGRDCRPLENITRQLDATDERPSSTQVGTSWHKTRSNTGKHRPFRRNPRRGATKAKQKRMGTNRGVHAVAELVGGEPELRFEADHGHGLSGAGRGGAGRGDNAKNSERCPEAQSCSERFLDVEEVIRCYEAFVDVCFCLVTTRASWTMAADARCSNCSDR